MVESINRDFSQIKKLQLKEFFTSLLDRIKCNLKNKKLLRKSLTQIDKELDLKKFLHRSRVTFASLLGLLTSKQSAFVDRMSRVAIRESTDLDATTDDDELESKQFEKDMNLFVQRMVKSTDHIDQRFINLYRVRKAHENKVRIGFKGLDFVK